MVIRTMPRKSSNRSNLKLTPLIRCVIVMSIRHRRLPQKMSRRGVIVAERCARRSSSIKGDPKERSSDRGGRLMLQDADESPRSGETVAPRECRCVLGVVLRVLRRADLLRERDAVQPGGSREADDICGDRDHGDVLVLLPPALLRHGSQEPEDRRDRAPGQAGRAEEGGSNESGTQAARRLSDGP